ncbi:MAG TPA: hypothetical protein H9815_03145 [Candidatus Ruania gallistercoris]|uniref:Uncharacterized protein n=1 Tax=Candidatus Ruania gallistercoris TaxID=2838746 RepID=A0A9D2ECQ6_9MICO|nr:hypothetical protein [Candidatus Ruania gallistercoris]
MNTTPPRPPVPPHGHGDPHRVQGPLPPGGAQPAHSPRPPIVWPAVFGLGALVLLWPLTSLTGVADTIGPAVRAIAVIALIGAAWIGVAGFSPLPRPVLTLTLTGVAGGLYLTAAQLLTSAASSGVSLLSVAVLADLVVRGAFGGVLAGLVAAGVQRLRAGGTR